MSFKVTGVNHVIAAVDDLDEAVKTFTETSGLTLGRRSKVSEMGIEAAYFPVGEMTFELVTPGNDAETNLIRKQLDRSGEGLYMLCFRVDDTHAAVAELREKGCTVTDPVGDEALEAFHQPSQCARGSLDAHRAPVAAVQPEPRSLRGAMWDRSRVRAVS